MNFEAARQILVALAAQIIGDHISDELRGGNGSITIPLHMFEEVIANQNQIMAESIRSTKALTDAINVLRERHELLVIEAPTIAVQLSKRFVDENQPALSSSASVAGATTQRGQATANDAETGQAAPVEPDRRPANQGDFSDFERRMREAYPDDDLEFG